MKQQKKEIEFLEFLSEELLMEKDTYSFIIKKYHKLDKLNSDFISLLENIIIDYNKFLNSIKQMLKNRKREFKKEDLLFRIATYHLIDVKHDTDTEVAKHLTHGSEVVKNKINERLKENLDVSKTIINLVNKLIITQDNNIRKIKTYINEENL